MALKVELALEACENSVYHEDVKEDTLHVFTEIASRWAIHYAWAMGGSGEHEEGRALDFMTMTRDQASLRVEMGREIANYLWRNRKRLGTWYVIYRRKIISIYDNDYGRAGVWNLMPDRGNSTDNHMDHVHVSFRKDAEYVPLRSGDWLEMASKREVKEAMREVLHEELMKVAVDIPNGERWPLEKILGDLRGYGYNAAKARDVVEEIADELKEEETA